MPEDNFLGRAIFWGLLAAVAGKQGAEPILWGIGGPLAEDALGFRLEDAVAAYQRQVEQAERQMRPDLLQALFMAGGPRPMLAPPPSVNTLAPSSRPAIPPSSAVPVPERPVERDARWRDVIVHPSVVLVLGKRGGGKSTLGYRLLELFRYVARPYVIGVPAAARNLLPDWMGIAASLEEVSPKAIALVDEAYLPYHARSSMAAQAKAMSQLLNLSRQRRQTLIFVSQEARQVDRNIASSASVVVFKDLGMLQLEFDRPELNKLAAQAKEALARAKGDKRRWSFVYAPDADFLGLLENELPSFWKPSLSHLFAIESAPATPRPPKQMTPQEKAQKAKEMRAAGASLKEIADVLGVTRGTVVNYLKGYPYRR